ncbi:MAG: 50S ribosomal protein L10 [Opitutae bacterium]|jgi:large subunit ribosomal protein L10|nr:50S ribosomal protein L10 [Opitutae bacterium]
MRPEKNYLIREASDYLSKSDYFFLTDYKGINSEDTSTLRNRLSERGAEFHVVKNSSLSLAVKDKNLPDLSEHLSGHTAIVIGGEDPSGVAKALIDYNKESKKVTVKAGALGDRLLTSDQVKQLAMLPNLDTLKSQLLSLLNTPSTKLVSLLSAPARSMATVLRAKADQKK